jgi:hypothetical protein
VSLGIAEIHQQSIPKQLRDMPIVALDDFRADVLVSTHNVPVVFRIELTGELRRVHQITEHHGELAAFGFW